MLPAAFGTGSRDSTTQTTANDAETMGPDVPHNEDEEDAQKTHEVPSHAPDDGLGRCPESATTQKPVRGRVWHNSLGIAAEYRVLGNALD